HVFRLVKASPQEAFLGAQDQLKDSLNSSAVLGVDELSEADTWAFLQTDAAGRPLTASLAVAQMLDLDLEEMAGLDFLGYIRSRRIVQKESLSPDGGQRLVFRSRARSGLESACKAVVRPQTDGFFIGLKDQTPWLALAE